MTKRLSNKTLLEQLDTCWHLTTDDSIKRHAHDQIKEMIMNTTNIEVKCCRCGKETTNYMIAPYGCKDDGDPICAECLDPTPSPDGNKNVDELYRITKDAFGEYYNHLDNPSGTGIPHILERVKKAREAVLQLLQQQKPKVSRERLYRWADGLVEILLDELDASHIRINLLSLLKEIGVEVSDK